MKKYIFIIVLIGIILASFLVIGSLNTINDKTKRFDGAGYILQSATSNVESGNVERYYFGEDSTYINRYNEQIKFNDINGNEVLADTNNFIHYNNSSISSLKKGVLLNLEDIEKEPIIYYNISSGKILKYQGGSYVISHLDSNLEFENFIYKISDNKYLIVSDKMKIHFSNGDIKDISEFIELEYLDNEIIKLYNQDVTYQTISSSVYIEMPNDIKIDLENKLVSKSNINKLSLNNMVIDSDDNIEITDFEETNIVEEEKTDEENLDNNTSTNNNEQNNNNNNITDQEAESSNTQNNVSGNVVSGDENNDEFEEETVAVEPVFKLEGFEADSLGFYCRVVIQDQNNTLITNHTVTITENSTGKVVYTNEIDMSRFEEELSISTLNPETEYTFSIESSYRLGEFEYTKKFINKVFSTSSIGIEYSKDYFTDTSLKFKFDIDTLSKFKSADFVLMNANGDVLQRYPIEKKEDPDEEVSVEFFGLTPNTEYKVVLENVLYNNQILVNAIKEPSSYKTLKNKPELGKPVFEINKRKSTFELSVDSVADPDNGIIGYRYEIYEAGNALSDSEPVLSIETDSKEPKSIDIDDIKIFRNTGYVFKVIAIFDDNEKNVEYESVMSEEVMKLDGDPFPTIRFEATNITFERIEGKIIIEDEYNTVDVDGKPFTITYSDSVGTIREFQSSGSLVIPVSVNNLRANETYRFSVYGTIDLNDNNQPIENCYMGSTVVKTKEPEEFLAKFNKNDVSNTKDTFSLQFNLGAREGVDNNLEATTLSSIVFNIYAGQVVTDSPVRTVKLVDRNVEPYESELKESLYDNEITITPEFFGAQNKDFKEKYYTVTVTQATDYTDYPNDLPIVENTFTFETVRKIDYPSDPDNAINVLAIKNKFAEQYPDITSGYRDDLDPETVVGYSVSAGISDEQVVNVIYYLYDADTDELVQEVKVPVRRKWRNCRKSF